MGKKFNYDKKDLALINELNVDARQSYRKLAKTIGLSKDVVNYRIKRLFEKKVLERFKVYLDYSALGLLSYRTYIKLQHTTPQIEQEISDGIKKFPGLRIMGRMEGEWNYGWVALAKTPFQFNKNLNNFLKKFSRHIQQREVGLMVEERYYLPIINKKSPSQRYFWGVCETSERQHYDAKDIEILQLLFVDARSSLAKIAQETNITPRTVNQRIKRMQKVGIIKRFGVVSDLGQTYYKIMINLEDIKKLPKVYEFANKHAKKVRRIFRALGGADVEIDLFVDSFKELLSMIDQLKIDLQKDIKNYRYHTFTGLHTSNEIGFSKI